MREKEKFTLLSNALIARDVYRMRLAGDTGLITAPGQFVMVEAPGFYLRRPISVHDAVEGELTLIYKCVGAGTAALSQLQPGITLDVITGLGNGYTLPEGKKQPLLVGGGVGVPPLYLLAKKLVEAGYEPSVVLGFNTAEEVFCVDEFAALGLPVVLCTADGSRGLKGFVTEGIRTLEYDCFYACGPLPMLKAVCRECEVPGQLSLEERMGCGFGACMGCSIETRNGVKRVCKDGPVFDKEELLWQI